MEYLMKLKIFRRSYSVVEYKVSRLLEPNSEGIRSRIELLGELISSKKLGSIPDVYDQMKDIIAVTERNDRFQSDSDGLQQPDVFHSELRERAIEQVLSDIDYYSTVSRPGEKVSENELRDWAKSMADPNTYGDEMANMAIADRYRIQLVIFRAGELLTVVDPRDGNVEHRACLVNVGTHYKALLPRSELEMARKNSERLSKQN
ncbi:unnamed protein product [Rotaria sordida]|uniref:OTU domain-containing protein n=1 Tax=Rotaria sordida TaxID=392033 RepID=A0A815RF50_9BILA|nr:unnamed protein product [Rotaria sordida]CAF1475065.1 unnamed protein product [Rotaria sordida]CAF1646235.1 unnamed protein product [Rotaria sordida]CAF4101019.1 unnamed protein product [Rotaria sordida]